MWVIEVVGVAGDQSQVRVGVGGTDMVESACPPLIDLGAGGEGYGGICGSDFKSLLSLVTVMDWPVGQYLVTAWTSHR